MVESVSVSNVIKSCHIDNYRTSLTTSETLVSSASFYKFMPVVDGTRTNLAYELPNASDELRIETADIEIHDALILERERHDLKESTIAGLQGCEGSYDREGIREPNTQLSRIGTEGKRANLIAFMKHMLQTSKAAGVRMGIHPDEPPCSLFVQPRVESTADAASSLLDGKRGATDPPGFYTLLVLMVLFGVYLGVGAGLQSSTAP